MSIKIHIISASASEESRSRKCLPFLIDFLKSNEVEISQSDIRDFTPMWINNRDLEEFPKEYQDLYATIEKVDGVIFVFPIYNYTVSSTAKAFSEVISDALENKPVGFLAAAGSNRSHLAVTDFMKSMMFEQDTLCYPKFAMITKAEIVDDKIIDEFIERIKEFADGFTQFVTKNI